jgi:hypothetical protein
MGEASSTPRWILTVWFASGVSRAFEFDAEPRMSTILQSAVSYHGEREGRPMRANVSIDQVSAWSLEETSR